MNSEHDRKSVRMKKPRWLIRNLPVSPVYEQVKSFISDGGLHTVCRAAKCPNRFECFSKRTATFLIMGLRCTRNCRFCSIGSSPCTPPDPDEPRRVAEAAKRMGLRYVVVTSVTRDDLPDGGAHLFAETIREIRKSIPHALIEVLVPDFQGDAAALAVVLAARPNVLNHNIETVSRLYPAVRPEAVYERSMGLLSRVRQHAPSIPVKSGMMLGLGETEKEIGGTLMDLHDAGCRLVTIGQYLQPSEHHLPVHRYVSPEEFEMWRGRALEIGFSNVSSGPFVRSSYHAADFYHELAFKKHIMAGPFQPCSRSLTGNGNFAGHA